LLQAHAIDALADVRRFPGSRRHPHFARERLEPLLRGHGIGYHWMPELGGRRSPRKDSPNTGWRVDGFRGYADYMETPEFRTVFTALISLAKTRNTAIMCAEALWWQCHRRLLSDAFFVLDWTVLHIQSPDKAPPHRLMPPAHLREGKLSYADPQEGLDLS
jgi:uncharacterized protein (DUF488 family)